LAEFLPGSTLLSVSLYNLSVLKEILLFLVNKAWLLAHPKLAQESMCESFTLFLFSGFTMLWNLYIPPSDKIIIIQTYKCLLGTSGSRL
jgi:hypothetical protein